ncbi:hypothetical protein [Ciceribacter sp. RN22]|uniref:hypothetical protein n=1 Tax=Ciceribacter sp. RN22 TaxID=2954932 RepID=UPI00209234D0|nr:hypothetical protein [Ciceribacter sp. RN22]MCO6178812.1 hypothetical protein [Ciceribacter sp. RN22]
MSGLVGSKLGFSDRDVEDIKAAAGYVLANFNKGTGTELMAEAHARWPKLPEQAWPLVMIAVEVALDYHVNQQIAEIESERF